MFNIFSESENIEAKFEKREVSNKVAVIGISAKLPKAENYRDFWNNLMNKMDCVDFISEDRKADCDSYFKFIGKDLNEISYQQMGFINDIDKFDYSYFKIPYQDAALMDPRQRLFLETSISALIDAGYPEDKIMGKNVGVYVGSSNSDTVFNYDKILFDSQITNPVAIVNNMSSMIASRISYLLDLKGPSMTIDTSCSSSLVSIHEAYQAILDQECEMAIAGGCNITNIPMKYDVQLGIESSTYRTRAFDNDSDGTGFGEGVVALVLKPLYNAIQDNDNIYAIIESSLVKNQGTSIGVASPSVDGQMELIYENIQNAGINAEDMSFIEAHGTGTNIGDVIEVEAIKRAYEKLTDKKQFCAINSVKNNVGHLLSASGATGFLKSILTVKNRKFPPIINYSIPNRKIDFTNSPVFVNQEQIEFDSDKKIYGSVSSFGMSGTNCNIIVSEYKDENRSIENQRERNIITLSAKDQDSLKELVWEYIIFLSNDQELSLQDIAYTLNCRRTHYPCRVAFVIKNKEDLIDKLQFFYRNIGKNVSIDNIFYVEKIQEQGIISRHLDVEYNLNDMEKICEAYIQGNDIKWNKLYNDSKVVSLPTYKFKKSRCWYTEVKSDFILLDDVELEKDEMLVVEAWAKLFGLKEVELSQDIYDVGGDSLSLVSIFSELDKEIENIILEEFIEYETLEAIIEYVRTKKGHIVKKSNFEIISTNEDYKIGKISNGVNGSNSYLIFDDTNCTLIDAGVKISDLDEILDELHIPIINYNILTHAHFDHIYSANEISNKYHAKLVLHQLEVPFACLLQNKSTEVCREFMQNLTA
ncbi:beta-ketoacyl synthase N-terminal-like domain-containing protein [Margalitia sp. FSL K6-0131]|uniref:beta-ketoacyl synthase N-terminal-like domain-containing protein n=1 Tax=Margalitia sp. FSL K6-0131 TaxID=2954604 RepID=UPI0030F73C27